MNRFQRHQDHQDRIWPPQSSDNNKPLWILGIMAGALGVYVVVSAI